MNVNSNGIGYQNLPAYIALAGTAVQKIPWTGNSTPLLVNQLLASPSALQIGIDPDLASGGLFDLHPFVVRVVGKASVVTTATVTIGLYNDASMTATAGNLIASTGASASITGSATAEAEFMLQATLLWSSSKLSLNGVQLGFIGSVAGTSTIVAPTALTTQTLAPAASALNFSIGITYSVANTGSLVTISEFSTERI